MYIKLLEFLLDYRVIVPVNEAVLLGLILNDTHLSVCVVLKLVVIAVQVVRGDIEKDGNIGTEVIHIVQLEAAQLNDIILMWVFCYLQCKTVTNVTSQTSVVTSIFEDMIDEARCCGLSITSSNTYHLRVGVSTSKFYFTNDMCTLCDKFLNHRSFFRNTRTLDDFISIENLLFCVLSLFPFYTTVIKHLLILVLNG